MLSCLNSKLSVKKRGLFDCFGIGDRGRGGERKGKKKERRGRGACRNTPIFRLQQLYDLCGTIN